MKDEELNQTTDDKKEWEESVLKNEYQDILKTEDCFLILPEQED